jgi:hypothetical protein
LKKSETKTTARESFSRFLYYHKPTEHHPLRAGVQETHIPEKERKKKRVSKQRKMGSKLCFFFLSGFLLGFDQSVA